jgi:Tol biopolymer transport system component
MLLDAASGAQKELLSERQNIAMPTFSPDGERIAFFQKIEGDQHLFVVGADGAERGQQNIMPSWSGDGQSLVFLSGAPHALVPQTRHLRSGERSSGSLGLGQAELCSDGWGRANRSLPLSDGVWPKTTLVRDLQTGQEKPLGRRLRVRSGGETVKSSSDPPRMIASSLVLCPAATVKS